MLTYLLNQSPNKQKEASSICGRSGQEKGKRRNGVFSNKLSGRITDREEKPVLVEPTPGQNVHYDQECLIAGEEEQDDKAKPKRRRHLSGAQRRRRKKIVQTQEQRAQALYSSLFADEDEGEIGAFGSGGVGSVMTERHQARFDKEVEDNEICSMFPPTHRLAAPRSVHPVGSLSLDIQQQLQQRQHHHSHHHHHNHHQRGHQPEVRLCM